MDNKKTVNTLCGWSLGCYLGCGLPGLILLFIFAALQADADKINESSALLITGLVFFAAVGVRLSGWILMIIARVKDKKSKFALTLMWVYIGLAILRVIFYIVCILFLVVIGNMILPDIVDFVHHF